MILGPFVGKMRTGGKRIYINGYFYRIHKVFRDKGYFCCSKAGNAGCKARGHLVLGSSPPKYKITHHHNHPEEHNEKIVLDFMNQLKVVCKSGVNMTVKEIYEDVARIHPEGAKLKTFNMLRTTLYEWKKQDN